tara:strand:+ start:6216 stop:7838 length:1623 start_codon:yes stop_codon:yes gene_type:complete
MRLIRLTSDDSSAFFDNSFNEDIIIKPNSKIALSNLTADIPTNSLVVDADNDTISYQLQNANAGTNSGGQKTITLINGQYGGGGITTDSLINQIQTRLNASMTMMSSPDVSEIVGAGSKEIGGMWKLSKKTSTTGDKKTSLNVDYKMSLNKTIDSTTYESLGWTIKNVALTTAGLTGRTGGNLNTFDSYMYNSNYMAMGAGGFRSRIYNLIDSTDATLSDDQLGIAIAFSDKDPATWIDDIDPDAYGYENIVCGVQVSKSDSDYAVIKSDGWDDDTTALQPTTFGTTIGENDILQVGMNFGRIGVQIIQDDGEGGQDNSEIFVPLNAPDTTKLYPIIFFLGGGATGATANSGACRLGKMLYYDNPYDFTKTTTDSGLLGTIAAQPQSTNPSNSYFNWGAETLANHLGYDEVYYPTDRTYTLFESSFNILGERRLITDASKNDNYIVELMNLQLQSYDGYSDNVNNIRAGRKNILATIPIDQDVNNILRYNATTPYFLNLDNKGDVILRNIRARLLNLDYSPVETQGLTVMTLLIKDSSEM